MTEWATPFKLPQIPQNESNLQIFYADKILKKDPVIKALKK